MRWSIAWLVGLVACDPAPPDTADTGDTVAPTGCPAGLHPSTADGLLLIKFTLDGLDLFPGFDADGVYDGEPSSCVNDDGTEATWVFVYGEVPYGRVRVAADAAGSYSLLDTSAASYEIDLFGLDPPVVFRSGAGSFQSGGFVVNSVGTPFQHDVIGYASAGGHTLDLNASGEASP
jgi:hypothetical protein